MKKYWFLLLVITFFIKFILIFPQIPEGRRKSRTRGFAAAQFYRQRLNVDLHRSKPSASRTIAQHDAPSGRSLAVWHRHPKQPSRTTLNLVANTQEGARFRAHPWPIQHRHSVDWEAFVARSHCLLSRCVCDSDDHVPGVEILRPIVEVVRERTCCDVLSPCARVWLLVFSPVVFFFGANVYVFTRALT